MVRGLEIFRERFRRFEGSFIIIGGAACDQWFADNHLEFRATKDLDMVLIVEIFSTPNPFRFGKDFWQRSKSPVVHTGHGVMPSFHLFPSAS